MEIRELLTTYKKNVDKYSIDKENIDYSFLESHIRSLELIARVENSSLTILDLYRKEYIFVRNQIKDIVDYNEEHADKLGFLYFYSIMHPDDVCKVIDTNIKALEFYYSVLPENRTDYKIISEFRLRGKTAQYIRIIQQIAILELDKKGNIWLALMLHDVASNQSENKAFQSSIVNLKSNKQLFFEKSHLHNKNVLSKREVEVLNLLAQGMMSKEIAEQLYISVNTVNNHRQKIIEKMDVANTGEALSYAKKIGII